MDRSNVAIGFRQEFIRRAVWLCYRFCLSYRDVEDLLSERGISVSYETIRRWRVRFGPVYVIRLRKRSRPRGDQWFVEAVLVRIDGKLRSLHRAVDQDGQILDFLVQTRRNTRAAARFFRRLLKQQGQARRQLVTDKLRSYRPAHGERRMGRLKSTDHAQRFPAVHGTLIRCWGF